MKITTMSVVASGVMLGILSIGVTLPSKADVEELASIDNAAIAKNRETGNDWPAHGFDDAGTRFSPLEQINDSNVNGLNLEWSYSLASTRGVEATPIVVDGVMYVTAPWSVVHAIDAHTGEKLWVYDPKVPRSYAEKGCCDVVNRGVAVYEGKVFVGSFDGRLIALNAQSGERVWEVDTLIDHSRPYTITGAPRVFNGKVIIGNGGAEYGVRGYITAYDADTGEEAWRWFTVPGDPSEPFENEAMAMAAETWDPSGRYWEAGGGGTAWHSMVFDPELNLMYVGTGNGSPWAHRLRSPGGGDNLFLASIVALNPDTGEYVWHYQQTPGDNWDYTSAQDIILADIMYEGEKRKVLLHAPKNGFFFVIDRETGDFLSAENFVPVNWATGYDPDGRPIETPEARSEDTPFDAIPGPFGGHNWHAMSYSKDTGLAYFPAQHVPVSLQQAGSWSYAEVDSGQPMSGTGWNVGMYINPIPPSEHPFGRLLAWDPIAQEEIWRYEHTSPWNGGTLVTAGNLVFQGTADARFMAFNATTGEKLWEAPLGTGAIAAPVTYEADGRQFVSIAVGWGGVYGLFQRGSERSIPGTVYTFSLDGEAQFPEFTKHQLDALVSGVDYNPEDIEAGTALYVSHCAFCHGVPGIDRGGNIPNLGYSNAAIIEHLEQFVLGGPLIERGMPDFTGRLTEEEVNQIKAFILGTADAIRPASND
ncbi:PQQ-dependent dehydrogenase, methanol/ethanol family [Vreelandella alkaliphila]|uniref:PQQ-dependent dehydrogenase, methanol/ethanol family n=1 Tax=Vreelandella alkaliphila TaxID=272774 RepID=UPI003FD6F126